MYMIKSIYDNKLANLVLGLFDPSKFGLPVWLNYKIQDAVGEGLMNYGRFMYVIANRDGEMGGVCPLFFDGATCTFHELPKPTDTVELQKWYDLAKDIKAEREKKRKVMSLLFMKNEGKTKRTRKGTSLHCTKRGMYLWKGGHGE